MRSAPSVIALIASLLPATCAVAQSAPTAARITEPGRTMARPLDLVLAGQANKPIERTLLVVIDACDGLKQNGFGAAFAKAVADNKEVLARTHLGLGIVGHKDCIVVPPTLEHARVVDAVKQQCTRGASALRNVYESMRLAADAMYRSKGERTILLVTMENGDLEDEVEKTAQQLAKAKIRVEVLASETTLADSYWQRRPNHQKPPGTTLFGGDGAIVDIPFGFLFQIEAANEVTPSGYAMWGLNRLAAATDGRVFLHASTQQLRHTCSFYGACLFCNNSDHELPDSAWNSALVTQFAPITSARKEALKEMGRDPAFRLVMKTWQTAAKEGLVSSAPAVKVRATSASPDRVRAGRDLRLTLAGNFDRGAKRALAAANKAGKLRDQLAGAIKNLPEGVSPRARAAAEYTLVLLQLTRVNLLTFVGFCKEWAPKWFDERDVAPLAPEVLPFDVTRNPSGIGYSNLSLCHGVRPFYNVELPGGPEFQEALRKLDAMFNGFQHRYGKSQFGYALRRNGIARFHPTFPGISKGPVRRRPKSANQPKGPITPKRPTRRGGGSGPAGGPTTGGGE